MVYHPSRLQTKAPNSVNNSPRRHVKSGFLMTKRRNLFEVPYGAWQLGPPAVKMEGHELKFFTANKQNEFNMFSLSVLIKYFCCSTGLNLILYKECGRHCLYFLNRKAASHAKQASSAIFLFFIGPSDLHK